VACKQNRKPDKPLPSPWAFSETHAEQKSYSSRASHPAGETSTFAHQLEAAATSHKHVMEQHNHICPGKDYLTDTSQKEGTGEQTEKVKVNPSGVKW